MADKVGPADAKNAPDPSAVVGVLGEIERQYSESASRQEDEDLSPLNLAPLARAKRDGDEVATDTEDR